MNSDVSKLKEEVKVKISKSSDLNSDVSKSKDSDSDLDFRSFLGSGDLRSLRHGHTILDRILGESLDLERLAAEGRVPLSSPEAKGLRAAFSKKKGTVSMDKREV